MIGILFNAALKQTIRIFSFSIISIDRPTFALLCRYIQVSDLKERLRQNQTVKAYLRLQF